MYMSYSYNKNEKKLSLFFVDFTECLLYLSINSKLSGFCA